MNKNFGLTETEFEGLVKALQIGDDTLFERVFLHHFKNCVKYLMHFHKAGHADAYDATMLAMLKFHKRLCAGKLRHGNLEFLFTKMASQFLFENKSRYSKDLNLEEALSISDANPLVNTDTIQVMEKAWEYLEKRCVTVLKAFYYDGVALIDLAEQLNRKPEAVRKQKQRCLESLRLLFVKLS